MKRNKMSIIILLSMLSVCIAACQKEGTEEPGTTPGPDDGQQEVPVSFVSDIDNPNEGKEVSYHGATVTVRFDASADWSATLVLKTAPEKEWASISSSPSGEAKEGCRVRVVIDENKTDSAREAELWLSAEGYEDVCAAVLVQAESGASSGAKLNVTLNTYMHEILKEDYLFKDAYNALEVDLTVNYTEFLNRHLLALGDANLEDGGYYKSHQAGAGERYIYTSIAEVMYTKSGVETKSSVTGGFGFGPFMSTALDNSENPVMGITPAYVRKGSPAEIAGIRRGDVIYMVNGMELTKDNYINWMNALYQNMSGSYSFTYLRDNGNGFQPYESGQVTASTYVYNPVLHVSVIEGTDIGYLVYEAFDMNSQEYLESAINGLKSAGISELILDLRYNSGGAVAQSRWLAGCIAGAANWNKTFTRAVYHDGSVEDWKFNYGYDNDTDNLGLPVDLGLDRVYVICSYNTASAAELIISSLEGIDFDIRTIGSVTEGKNVGMTVTETSAGGRKFQFSPVTFRLYNAKGWSGYADGIVPDALVNNDNGVLTDDYDYLFPYSFADWGDIQHQSALQLAVLDILGAGSQQASVSSLCDRQLRPVSCQPMKAGHGRYGNLVYKSTK